MYIYKKNQKPMLFKMPEPVSVSEQTIIETIDKKIMVIEFFEEYEGNFVIEIFDITSGKYDTIYSNVELKLNENDHVIDYYEF